MRQGYTVIELVIVLVIMGVLLAMGFPQFRGARDRWEVRGAATEVFSVFATARELAIMQGRYATVAVDSAARTVLIKLGSDTIQLRQLGERYGVAIRSDRDSMAYSPVGLGYGAADQSIVVSRGAAQESVVVSRLGRVR